MFRMVSVFPDRSTSWIILNHGPKTNGLFKFYFSFWPIKKLKWRLIWKKCWRTKTKLKTKQPNHPEKITLLHQRKTFNIKNISSYDSIVKVTWLRISWHRICQVMVMCKSKVIQSTPESGTMTSKWLQMPGAYFYPNFSQFNCNWYFYMTING